MGNKKSLNGRISTFHVCLVFSLYINCDITDSCDEVKTKIRLVRIKFTTKLGSGINILQRIELILALLLTLIKAIFKAKSSRFSSWTLPAKC